MHYTNLLTLSMLASLALAVPLHTLEKRGQTFTCGTSKVPLRISPGSTKDVSQQTCLDVNHGNAPFYSYKDGDIAATKSITKTAPPDTTCEHIMEVQMLKQVLESKGGPCEQLAAEVDPVKKQELRTKFTTLTTILNSAPNLVFAQNVLEKQKGDLVNKAQTGKPYKDNPKKADANLHNRLKAVNDFVNVQTGKDSRAVAAHLDTEIAKLFPGTTAKVADSWAKVLTFASTSFSGVSPPPVAPSAARPSTPPPAKTRRDVHWQ